MCFKTFCVVESVQGISTSVNCDDTCTFCELLYHQPAGSDNRARSPYRQTADKYISTDLFHQAVCGIPTLPFIVSFVTADLLFSHF